MQTTDKEYCGSALLTKKPRTPKSCPEYKPLCFNYLRGACPYSAERCGYFHVAPHRITGTLMDLASHPCRYGDTCKAECCLYGHSDRPSYYTRAIRERALVRDTPASTRDDEKERNIRRQLAEDDHMVSLLASVLEKLNCEGLVRAHTPEFVHGIVKYRPLWNYSSLKDNHGVFIIANRRAGDVSNVFDCYKADERYFAHYMTIILRAATMRCLDHVWLVVEAASSWPENLHEYATLNRLQYLEGETILDCRTFMIRR